jgi:hypothetical protein
MMAFSKEARHRTAWIILCLVALGCIQVALGTEDTRVVNEVNVVFDPFSGRKLYTECCITRFSGHVDCGCYYCDDVDEACDYYVYSDEDEEWTGGQIAGVVIGAIAGLYTGLAILVAIWCHCRKRSQRRLTDHAAYPVQPDQEAHVVAVPMGSATPKGQSAVAETVSTIPDGSKRTETTVTNLDGSKTTTVKVW